ncbi:hypothetical protein WJU23_07495 [Prosthecobacter sp. SYSU 5D2]|uniref:hypothetical protein n=1 Tax=Prosthecobacter sp. SYSU 5D2 TaxID=3134134 RepID=UPI0031FEB3D2
MLAKAALLVLSILWILLCMRFYTAISRENILQRRLIAIGAGLGAGLIYILGSMIITLLNSPMPSETPRPLEQAEDVRVINR